MNGRVFTLCSIGMLSLGIATTASATTVSRWSIVSSPNVPNYAIEMEAVGCGSPTDCWAVGYYFDDTGVTNIYQTLIEHWNGSTWAIVSSPNPGSSYSILYGVTCTSTSQCWAVGTYADASSVFHALVEKWDGNSWSVVSAPDSAVRPSSQLQSVTCTSTSQCWAAGFAFDQTGSNVVQTLIEQWDGNAWSVINSPNQSTIRNNQLYGVACAMPSQCYAVGYYTDSFNKNQTLIEQWNGGTWGIVTVPSKQNATLTAVTCPSTTECWAAGYYINTSGYQTTLTEHFSAATWAIVTSPNRGTGTTPNYVYGVACNSTSQCWMVGYATTTLIEQWDGTAWTLITSPNNGASSNLLHAVTCPSVAECWATGTYFNGTHDSTLMEEFLMSPLQISSITLLGNGHISLQCLGVPNTANSVQTAIDPGATSFSTATAPTADSTGAFSYDDANPGTKKFYRLSFP